ncbi:hypothetical protein G4V62_07735 [Bacillaceae bacterium SIJ1]|uniref:PucR family transcriptional regulator n=1 Tax=Litoribacterium kuwaitense TaxID=1398745 RepID=UPI0013EC51F6|nr:PucR family transcriptional regulator [Litoribacterium kuwaitense]NGP44855.1 hypothetical protein [Litoribacterium kuwaitense]
MAVTVKSLMNTGGLAACKIIAGEKGSSQHVSSVTVMEVPDIVQWLKGGELLLTSLYPIRDDAEAQVQLIHDLKEAGTAALAIKPHRFIKEIPQSMVDEAERLDFPLIEIPKQVSYLDILSPAMGVIFDEQMVLQEEVEQAHKVMTESAHHSRDFASLLLVLVDLTKNVVTLESLSPMVDVPSPPFKIKPLTPDQLEEIAELERPVQFMREAESAELGDCLVAPVMVDNDVVGLVTCWGGGHRAIDMMVLERASLLFSLEFMRQLAKVEVQQQYKNDFLRDLFLSDWLTVSDLEEKSKMFRYDPKKPYVCITIVHELSEEKLEKVPQPYHLFEKQVLASFPDTVIGSFRSNVYVLCPEEHFAEAKDLIHEQALREFGKSCVLGASRPGIGVEGARKSFREAEQTVSIAKDTGRIGELVHFSSLGLHRLFAVVQDAETLQQMYEETIGPLDTFDEENDIQLVTTLETYFSCNEQLKWTSEALFVHVNTLKYRLRKVQQLTGLDVKITDDKTKLYLGLKMRNHLQRDYRLRQ